MRSVDMKKLQLLMAVLLLVFVGSAFGQKDKKPKPEDLLLMIETLQAQVTDLQAQVDAFGPHSPDFTELLTGLYRDDTSGYDTLVFSSMNVQVVNGTGHTSGTNADAKGTGNLIIGYNEARVESNATVPCPSNAASEPNCNRRWGSHMLVIGDNNNYSAYGGIVSGQFNETTSEYASVSGGQHSVASGASSSVSGGDGNTASGEFSSVSGGVYNIAGGNYASVSGGQQNEASGLASSVSGGLYNWATNLNASVSGGAGNWASGPYSSVSGGTDSRASGDTTSISGGWFNEAIGYASSVSGGLSKTAVTDLCVVGDNGVDC
jgi:hypothetical protein